MPKVLVTHQLPGEQIHQLPDHCDMNVWMGPGLLPAASLRDELTDCEGLLCLLTDRIDKALLDTHPQLRFIASMSVGVDHIDVKAATARGIAVGNTPGVLVETTADASFALLLAAARRLVEADHFVRGGHWRVENAWSPEFFTGKDVAGSTLGIVGLGEVGQAVARRAAGFGMKVLAWNRSARNVPGVEMVELDDLLADSDFVSINVALGEETRNLIDARRLGLMKRDAVLVNTARGGIVDEVALAEALSHDRLAAAGLDVFEREPVPDDHPLLSLPNVVTTPHIGSATLATREKMADMAALNMLAALGNEKMPNCVNPEVYQS
ncbi:D-glycerate dehydrogenase [Congregibacter brevis]|uniref:D-glycerate dehydrogenase n=1 Tax=Congregibacter brevis TaxID=3081201 RepID=A0ABZ0IEL9_9GAMM|nr:D-glycerate dehydrogenase [Congregibacter sp. IMCC45268]